MFEKALAALVSIAESLKEIAASLKNASVKPAAGSPAAPAAGSPAAPAAPAPAAPAAAVDDLGLGLDDAPAATAVKITREFLLTKAREVSEKKGRAAVKWALTNVGAGEGGVKGLKEELFEKFSKALDEAPAA